MFQSHYYTRRGNFTAFFSRTLVRLLPEQGHNGNTTVSQNGNNGGHTASLTHGLNKPKPQEQEQVHEHAQPATDAPYTPRQVTLDQRSEVKENAETRGT